MKNIFMVSCILASICTLAACEQATNNGEVIITFTQNGQPNLERIVEVGDDLTDIPLPVEKEGYIIVWDRTNFNDLHESITVKAVETPKTYTITYEVGKNVSITATTQSVVFASDVVLYEPSLNGWSFVGWYDVTTGEEFEDGKYTVARNIKLKAIWVSNSNDEYSPNK